MVSERSFMGGEKPKTQESINNEFETNLELNVFEVREGERINTSDCAIFLDDVFSRTKSADKNVVSIARTEKGLKIFQIDSEGTIYSTDVDLELIEESGSVVAKIYDMEIDFAIEDKNVYNVSEDTDNMNELRRRISSECSC